MDLSSGKPYWHTTMDTIPTYKSLEADISCDVLIIGAGGSGSQLAYYFSEYDLDIVVVDKGTPGNGSTAVNTALLQYAGDKMFFELVNSFGEENAARHLKLCEMAINELEQASSQIGLNADFIRRDSLYYASQVQDTKKLEQEYSLLTKHGFDVEWLTAENIASLYPFQKDAAILYKNDAEVNPLKLTIGLLEFARKKGVRIFSGTEITGKKLEEDSAEFFTKNGYSIKAKKAIIAAGYESLEFKKDKNAVITSSYNIITSPVDNFKCWYNRTLIWETARPYIYLRTTADNRIIIGGLDESTSYTDDRDAKILHKRDQLMVELQKLFPDLQVTPEYYIGAFYGGTHDGLPMIGQYEDFPNCYFLMGYGDNGLVYSMLLGKIIKELVINGNDPDSDLYLQTRPFMKYS
jgi:glycine/D-amino acid oxidase-like deaminating enzyme